MNNFYLLLSYIVFGILNFGGIVNWIIYMFSAPRMLHAIQMESYSFRDYSRWLSKNVKTAFWPGVKQLLACGGFYIVVALINYIILRNHAEWLSGAVLLTEFFAMICVFLVANIAQIVRDKKARKNAKKKLVYTARAKRLMFWNFILIVLLAASFVPSVSYLDYSDEQALMVALLLNYISELAYYSLFIALLPINMLIANWLAWPTERAVHDHYVSSARRKLKKKAYKKLIRIGITGSYGKTSTKFILKTILSEKYNVLATPESYNTTMGNVRIIREQLQPEHEVFISEMGARYKGDIAEICEFVRPQIGIITSIGPQHLETFKTIDKIVDTKAELIRSMDNEGVVVLPRDNEYCQKLYNGETRKKYCYTIKNSNADVYAKDIVLDENGCNFTAVTSIGEIKCVSKLLGEHNIENILGAITIAVHLGLTKEQIEAGVSKIEPIPHRLQILDSHNGTIVIDDAFNSNPVGAKMALDVLKSFSGRKIIITPGMVELGESERKENKKFGRHMADCVDVAILVGMKRSEPIVQGLREGKFDDMNIHVVPDLNAATEKLAQISTTGDVILFENDLPDSYNE